MVSLDSLKDYNQDEQLNAYNILGVHRSLLPVSKMKREILYCVENNDVLIVMGETGSGKTTQLPQFLHQAGYTKEDKMIAVTLPKRITTISTSKRVAEEMNVQLGQEVAFVTRFASMYNKGVTKIKFMTDGVLLREINQDPLLTDYSAIILDDAHERTLNTDLLLGLTKKILKKRKDLKVIVSSATLDAQRFAEFFLSGPQKSKLRVQILTVEGTNFPVSIQYLKHPCQDYVRKAIETTFSIHHSEEIAKGDILVFLTGKEEVENFISMVFNEYLPYYGRKNGELRCYPLHAGLAIEKQMRVFERSGHQTRKAIISTNVAETGITLENVGFVVDCMQTKLKFYNHKTNSEDLLIIPTSQAAAKQRAGRAGRVKPGKCFRLCTQDDFQSLHLQTTPEILRANMTNAILVLKSLGISNIINFDLIDRPNRDALIQALQYLFSLGIIDAQGELTEQVGRLVAELPLEPHLAAMLIKSCDEQYACSEEILTIVSFLSVDSVWMHTRDPLTQLKAKLKTAVKEGDLMTLINVYNRYTRIRAKDGKKNYCDIHLINEKLLLEVVNLRKILHQHAQKLKLRIYSSDDDIDNIQKCVLAAFLSNVAQKQPDGRYASLTTGEVLEIHPTSVLYIVKPRFVCYAEAIGTGKLMMKELMVMESDWLMEVAPHLYQEQIESRVEQRHQEELKRQDQHQKSRQKKRLFQRSTDGETKSDASHRKIKKQKYTLSFEDDY